MTNYETYEQNGWFWCRWWYHGRWHGTQLYHTRLEAESMACAMMCTQGL